MMEMLAAGAISIALQGSPGPCAHRNDLLRILAERHSEAPVARGLSETGALLEIFATNDGETWTALGTFPSGLSCLIASGRFWEVVPIIVIDPERPS